MNNFFIRLLLVVLVGFFLITGLANAMFSKLTSSHYDQVAVDLAAELAQKLVRSSTPAPDKTPDPAAARDKKKGKKGNKPAPDVKTDKVESKQGLPKEGLSDVLEKINEHHLSWYYLTDQQGRLLPQTKPFAPDIQPIGEGSRQLDWRGQSYYEAVATVSPGFNLHVGFYSGPPVGLSRDLIEEQVPLVVALAMMLSVIIGTVLLYVISITMPMGALLAYCKKRDNGSTGGTLSLPGAVREVMDTQLIIEKKYKELDQKDEQVKERDTQLRKLNLRLEEEVNAAKKEKTVLYLKEAENQFIERLGSSFDSITTLSGIGDTMLTMFNTEFPNSFEFALFFSMNKKQEASLVSHIGFQNNPLEVYKGLGVMKGLNDSETDLCTVVEAKNVAESQFKEISQLTGANNVIMSPLRFQGRRLGLLVLFFRGQEQGLEHITRVINRAANVTAKALHHIVTYEEQVEAARTDELTGYPNKAYLPHLFQQILASADGPTGEKRPFSIFLVEGHDVLSINEKYGRPAGDTVIQELGKRIDKLLQQRRTETMGSWGDHLIRFQGAQFLVILRQVDSKKATIFAQRLRQVLEGEDFPCGVGRWSVGIGITTFPEDSTNPDELTMNVETALSYARGQSERNKIAHINSVPKAFRSAKLASNLGGSLDVFDPAALMQSLSISRKSGILTVTHPEGKMFWCFLENGRPTKARMGKFTGPQAIIEFLVLFESGEFSFSDLTSIDRQTLDDIGKLPKTFDVPGSLERALMDGALARDHFTSAHTLIKETALYVWPTPSAKNGEGFAAMKALKDPPSPEEEKAMKEILAIANGKIQLKLIFEKLDNLPTHTLWRGAALMVEHEMIQLKKLATSMAL